MNQTIVNTVVSAAVGGIIGGIVGAAVMFAGGKSESTYEKLTVSELTVKKQIALTDKDGKEDVVIKDGSVLANNVMLCKKFIGTQFQGHVVVANRMLTTPDDMMKTSMDQWKFYTEIGSSDKVGGEIVVRSKDGPAYVGKPITSGALVRVGFDETSLPQMWALHNASKQFMTVGSTPSPEQLQAANRAAGNANANAAAFNAAANAPVSATSTPNPAVANPAAVATPGTNAALR